MKYEIKKLKECKRLLKVSLDAGAFDEAFSQVIQGFQKKAKLRGFREGKAPLDMVKSAFGEEAKEEVIQKLVSESYYSCLEQSKVLPVGRPVIKDLKVENSRRLTYTAEFECSPEFKVKSYKGLKVTRASHEVHENEVQKALESLLDGRSEFSPLEVQRPVREGDLIRCDVQPYKDGSYVPGQTDVSFQVERRGNQEEYVDQLLGAQVGEQREIFTGLSPEEKAQGLVGRRPFCKIHVKEVKEKKQPFLDDSFAKSFGKENLDELRADIRHHLERLRQMESTEKMKHEIYAELLRIHEVALPDVLVEEQKKRLLQQTSAVQAPPGDSGPAESGKASEDREAEASEKARQQVKLYFILDRISEIEGIEPSSEEVDRRIQKLAQETGRSEEEIRKHFEDDIHHSLRHSMTADFLLSNASVTDSKVNAV